MRRVLHIHLLVILCLCTFACAKDNRPQSERPAWDTDIPPDWDGSERPSLLKRFSDSFSESSGFHFRKVRWGFSRERVQLAEAGNTIFERRDNAIVYKTKLNGVYCKLIYTFKNNRLRTAGYLSINSIPNANNLIKEAVDKHGVPDIHETYLDGLEEMVWKTPEMVIFCNLSPTVKKISPTEHQYSGRGLLKEIVKDQLPKQQPGTITYWDGAYTHVSPEFFNELHEVNFPLSELSFYEKQLLGVILKSGRIQIHGLGTIPQ